MKKMTPTIIINFKTYKQGKDVLKLAKIIEKVNPKTIIGVPASEISDICNKTNLKVFAEHVDPFEPGKNTGFILPEAVKKQGAKGVFLNHSEHKIKFNILKKTIKRCKQLRLKTAVFTKDIKESLKIKKLNPDYLIYEPPELVGGKTSVSKAKPKIISKLSKKLKRKFLIGAGVKKNQDLMKALELGASGIAISSGFVKAKNPKKTLKNLLGTYS